MKKKTVIKIISLLLAASIAFTPAQVLMAAQTETVETGTELPEEQTEAAETQDDASQTREESTQEQEESTQEEAGTSETQDDAAADPEGSIQYLDDDNAQEQETSDDGSDDGSQETMGTVQDNEQGDDVEIKQDDKPYLSLGADLNDSQRATVLSIMGIDPANLDSYDVVYVTNEEEHQYLDAYISSDQIGSRSLSSVVIVQREEGNGLNISTTNITYCTVGMYKNALTTAGVTDADIIVAGPTGISGTAALVGILKAYQQMTGENISEDVMDAALNELVITGQLEESLEGVTDEEVEEFFAYLKSLIAKDDLTDEEGINGAIDEACERYGVTLSETERQQIVDLLLKITSLGIDLNGLVEYAESLYDSFRNGDGIDTSGGIFESIGNFFGEVFSSIGDFFRNLLS